MANPSGSTTVCDSLIVPNRETSTHSINGTKPPGPKPSTSKKRKRPDESAQNMNGKSAGEPSVDVASSKNRPAPDRSPSPPVVDKNNWQGFCDIESEPAYFSVILREMGVKDVTVREVFAMDPDYLQTSIPQPIHGLILLFHYREFGNADQPAECPSNVWFANQLPAQNSCATLAMINILMNSTDVDIGEHLSQFKDFTRDFHPYQRGEALSSFDFVKRIHNSFAKKMDILESDKLLSHKVSRAQRLKAQESQPPKTPKRGTKSRRRASVDSTATTDSADVQEDTAHHFIAFLPIGTQVWKLDGLDKQPTSMGSFDPQKGESWLSAVADTIAALMAAGDDDYGVVALAQSPLRVLRARACVAFNTMKLIDEHLTQHNPDWKTSMVAGYEEPCPRLLGIEPQLHLHPVPDSAVHNIKHSAPASAAEMFQGLAKEMAQLAAGILAHVQAEAEEEQKAAQRRFDTGPVIKMWLEMLAENGHLEEHLHRFMPASAGRGKK